MLEKYVFRHNPVVSVYLQYMSKNVLWGMTNFLIPGWSPRPQGHKEPSNFEVGPQGPEWWII